jgi:hypothetical protein
VNRNLLFLVVLGGCLAAASTTFANAVLVRDPPRDAPGSTVLDIASIGAGHRASLIVHRLTAYRPWRPALLAKGGEVSFYFNTDNDRALERRLDVVYARGRLSALIKDSRGRLLGTGQVRRPSRRTIHVLFAPSLLRPGIRQYRWFAFAGFRCRHRYKTCGDTAPNGGKLLTNRLDLAPPPPRRAVPRPLVGRGYHQAFADNFNRLDPRNWTNRAFWDGAPPANAVYVKDGVLHLVSRRSQGYEGITVSSHGKRNFRYGYFEARMRWTKGPGAWPAFWLSSTYHYKTGRCPYLNAELDVFEGQGTEPSTFYGALHRNTNDVCGVPDETRPRVGWHGVGDMTTRFHVYSALWTKTEVIWYFDGRQVVRAPAFDSTDQQMFIMLDMWIGGWTSDPTAATPAELRTEVDWVKVWQR